MTVRSMEGSTAKYSEDHPYYHMDPSLQITQPCNVNGALSYTDAAIQACARLDASYPEDQRTSGPAFEYARDMSSIMSFLTMGNILYHGSHVWGALDTYPMQGKMIRMYEETIDLAFVFPDTEQGRKDKYLVRSLAHIRKCGDKNNCKGGAWFIRKSEEWAGGPANYDNWRRLGGDSWTENGVKEKMPDFAQTAVFIFVARLITIFHPSRFAFGKKIVKALVGMLSPIMPKGKNNPSFKAWLTGTYLEAIFRSKIKCMSMEGHTCLDSLVMSKFEQFLTTVLQFLFALFFQEQKLGMQHFGYAMPKYVHKAGECQNMPHAMWHRKSGEFLNAMIADTDALRHQLTFDCEDLEAKAGNLGGLGSVQDILQSEVMQRTVAIMVNLISGKKPSLTGMDMIDNIIKSMAAKKAGSSDPTPLFAVANEAKRVLTRDGQCAAHYTSPMAKDFFASTTCAKCSIEKDETQQQLGAIAKADADAAAAKLAAEEAAKKAAAEKKIADAADAAAAAKATEATDLEAKAMSAGAAAITPAAQAIAAKAEKAASDAEAAATKLREAAAEKVKAKLAADAEAAAKKAAEAKLEAAEATMKAGVKTAKAAAASTKGAATKTAAEVAAAAEQLRAEAVRMRGSVGDNMPGEVSFARKRERGRGGCSSVLVGSSWSAAFFTVVSPYCLLFFFFSRALSRHLLATSTVRRGHPDPARHRGERRDAGHGERVQGGAGGDPCGGHGGPHPGCRDRRQQRPHDAADRAGPDQSRRRQRRHRRVIDGAERRDSLQGGGRRRQPGRRGDGEAREDQGRRRRRAAREAQEGGAGLQDRQGGRDGVARRAEDQEAGEQRGSCPVRGQQQQQQ